MKGKRIIALLLVHLYMLTVAVPAACALSCPCLDGMHRPHAESCICHGQSGHQHLDGPDGCGHDHDTRIQLYTFDRDENGASSRIARHLCDALKAEDVRSVLPECRRGIRIPTPPDECSCETCATPTALRAPPAQA